MNLSGDCALLLFIAKCDIFADYDLHKLHFWAIERIALALVNLYYVFLAH